MAAGEPGHLRSDVFAGLPAEGGRRTGGDAQCGFDSAAQAVGGLSTSGALAHAADVLDAHPRLGVLSAQVLVGPENRFDPACERITPVRSTRAGCRGRGW